MAKTRKILNPVKNKKWKTNFGTLCADGWFSAAPDDLAVNRAIRTNNPGAINKSKSKWEVDRPGFVGYTGDDGKGNITTIYQTPEDGVSAWRYLLEKIYKFQKVGYFDLLALAQKYSGSTRKKDYQPYLDGWAKWSSGKLKPDTVVHLANLDEMQALALAEFNHEIGAATPLHAEQITFGLSV